MGLEKIIKYARGRIEDEYKYVGFDSWLEYDNFQKSIDQLEEIIRKFNELRGFKVEAVFGCEKKLSNLDQGLYTVISCFRSDKNAIKFQNLVNTLDYLINENEIYRNLPVYNLWKYGCMSNRLVFWASSTLPEYKDSNLKKESKKLINNFFSQRRSNKLSLTYFMFCRQFIDSLSRQHNNNYVGHPHNAENFVKSLISFNDVMLLPNEKMEIITHLMKLCYLHLESDSDLIKESIESDGNLRRLRLFLEYFPGIVKSLSEMDFEEFSPEYIVLLAKGGKDGEENYNCLLEGLSSFVPKALEALSIVNPRYKPVLESIIIRESKQEERNGQFMVCLAEEFNKDYSFLSHFNYLLNDSTKQIINQKGGCNNVDISINLYKRNDIDIIKIVNFFRDYYSDQSINFVPDLQIKGLKKSAKEFLDSMKSSLMNPREGQILTAENLEKCRQSIDKAVEWVNNEGITLVNNLLKSYNLFSKPNDYGPYLAKIYRDNIDQVFDFIYWCRIYYSNEKDLITITNPVDKKLVSYVEEKQSWLHKVLSCTDKLFELDGLFALSAFIILPYLYKKKGERVLDEIVSFTKDALEFYPTFFDVQIFGEYVSFVSGEILASDKLKNIIAEVEKCRNYAEDVKEMLTSQIKSQKDNIDQDGNPLIKLVIPDLFYLFRNQVERYNVILGSGTYFEEQVIPDLDQIVESDMELITLGCGTGVSELKIARAIAEHPQCKNLSVYLTDKSESMVREATFNFYKDKIDGLSSGRPKIKSIPKTRDMCNLDELKLISPAQNDKKKMYVLLGGTAGNFSLDDRQEIYNNIEKVMRTGDVFITTCGTEQDSEHYQGENEARWLFYPLKLLGISEKQIDELKNNPDNFEFDKEEDGNQKRLVGRFTLADGLNELGLKEGTKIQMIHSERFTESDFEIELSMFDSHIEKYGFRAIAVCYKK